MLEDKPLPHHAQAGRFARTPATWKIYALFAIMGFQQAVPGPAVAFLRSDFGWGPATAGLHFGAFALGLFLYGFANTPLMRWRRQSLVSVASLAMALATLSVSLGRHPAATVASMFCMGFASGGLLSILPSALADLHRRHHGTALAELNLGSSLGMVGATLCFAAVSTGGVAWRTALALPLIMVAAILVATRHVAVGEAAHGPASDTAQAMPRAARLCCLIVFLGVSVEWTLGFWGTQFLSLKLSVDPGTAAAASTVLFAGAIAGRLAASRLTLRVSCRTALTGALLLAAASLPVLWLSPVPLLSLAAMTASGAAAGLIYPMSLGAAVELAPACSARIAGTCAQAIGLAMLVAPLTLGVVAERVGIVTAFGLVVPLILLACVVLVVLRAERQSTTGHPVTPLPIRPGAPPGLS